MNKTLVTELLLGLDYATQLKFLLQKPVDPDASVAAKELVTNVHRSFAQTLSILTSSHPARVQDQVAQNLLISGEDASQAASIDHRSHDSTESRKRSFPLSKDRRGSYKRRSFFTLSHFPSVIYFISFYGFLILYPNRLLFIFYFFLSMMNYTLLYYFLSQESLFCQ